MLILQLFLFGLAFTVLGTIFYFRKRKLLGAMFILMGIMLAIVALIAWYLYPQTRP
ncbi:MAG: hypothetical protein Kow00127_02090 [Bacteroidales bacterium]